MNHMEVGMHTKELSKIHQNIFEEFGGDLHGASNLHKLRRISKKEHLEIPPSC